MAAAIPTDRSSATSVTPSYRRNGKLFSCEPCRRGKLRCDHNAPVCGRCQRRNKPSQCIYHPAPLTKPRSPSGSGSLRSPTSRASTGTSLLSPSLSTIEALQTGLVSPPPSGASSAHLFDLSAFRPVDNVGVGLENNGTSAILPSPGQVSATTITFPSDSTTLEDHHRTSSTATPLCTESAMSFRDSKAGFLGPTSYNAIFTENAGSLSIITEAHDAETISHLPPLTANKIQEGAEVLRLLRDMPTYQTFLSRWTEVTGDGVAIMQPALRIFIEDTWTELGGILQRGDADELRALSELVWRNTRKRISTNSQTTARAWARSACGQNLRWEVVGLVLCTIGLQAGALSAWDPLFKSVGATSSYPQSQATFTERLRKAAELCLCFCYESEVLNDLYIMFIYQELILVEILKGDAHYAAWQRNGEVCDAIVAMGLHQGNPVDDTTPFFLSQFRKRIFMSAYGRDKSMATYLGRPPRLSYRYCKMEPALDLSDAQLFLEGPDLDAAIATVDVNGWNTTGELSRATWERTYFQVSRIREDILEIALGSAEEDTSQQAEQIRLKLDQLHRTLPAFCRVSAEEVLLRVDTLLSAPSGQGRGEGQVMRQFDAMFLICIQASIAHTEFLLQRVLINRQGTDTKELIPISRRMLRLAMLARSKRDFFRDLYSDTVFLMTAHGLVAAGVLAIELLKQESTRPYIPPQSDALLPRSETIQDLSVFVSALASVGPGESNYAVCNQGCRALRKVLDQILSPSAHAWGQTPGSMGVDGGGGFEEMGLGFPTSNDNEFLQWLENVEWDKVQLPNA